MISHADKIYLAYMGLRKFEKFASVVYEKYSVDHIRPKVLTRGTWVISLIRETVLSSIAMIISPYWMKEKKSKDSLSPF